MFYVLDAIFLSYFICKLLALLKDQILSQKHIFKFLSLLIIKFIYYIAKNLSILYIFWAKLLLSLIYFQIKDIITFVLSINRFQLLISFIYYCQSSIYQKKSGI